MSPTGWSVLTRKMSTSSHTIIIIIVILNFLLTSSRVFWKWKSSIRHLAIQCPSCLQVLDTPLDSHPCFNLKNQTKFYSVLRFFSCFRLLTPWVRTISTPPGETFQLKLIWLSPGNVSLSGNNGAELSSGWTKPPSAQSVRQPGVRTSAEGWTELRDSNLIPRGHWPKTKPYTQVLGQTICRLTVSYPLMLLNEDWSLHYLSSSSVLNSITVGNVWYWYHGGQSYRKVTHIQIVN